MLLMQFSKKELFLDYDAMFWNSWKISQTKKNESYCTVRMAK